MLKIELGFMWVLSCFKDGFYCNSIECIHYKEQRKYEDRKYTFKIVVCPLERIIKFSENIVVNGSKTTNQILGVYAVP